MHLYLCFFLAPFPHPTCCHTQNTLSSLCLPSHQTSLCSNPFGREHGLCLGCSYKVPILFIIDPRQCAWPCIRHKRGIQSLPWRVSNWMLSEKAGGRGSIWAASTHPWEPKQNPDPPPKSFKMAAQSDTSWRRSLDYESLTRVITLSDTTHTLRHISLISTRRTCHSP